METKIKSTDKLHLISMLNNTTALISLLTDVMTGAGDDATEISDSATYMAHDLYEEIKDLNEKMGGNAWREIT